MKYRMLKSKIHQARVTDRNIDYEGSASIDRALMDAVGILPYESIQIYDISNGQRFETYVIEAPPGSQAICVNGAAARLVEIGDRVIIVAYADYDEEEVKSHTPRIIVVDEDNKIVREL